MEDYEYCLDRLRGQRLPYAIFFGYFLAWPQESDTCPCLSSNEKLHLLDKLEFDIVAEQK